MKGDLYRALRREWPVVRWPAYVWLGSCRGLLRVQWLRRAIGRGLGALPGLATRVRSRVRNAVRTWRWPAFPALRFPAFGVGTAVAASRSVWDRCRARFRELPDEDARWLFPTCTGLLGLLMLILLFLTSSTTRGEVSAGSGETDEERPAIASAVAELPDETPPMRIAWTEPLELAAAEPEPEPPLPNEPRPLPTFDESAGSLRRVQPVQAEIPAEPDAPSEAGLEPFPDDLPLLDAPPSGEPAPAGDASATPPASETANDGDPFEFEPVPDSEPAPEAEPEARPLPDPFAEPEPESRAADPADVGVETTVGPAAPSWRPNELAERAVFATSFGAKSEVEAVTAAEGWQEFAGLRDGSASESVTRIRTQQRVAASPVVVTHVADSQAALQVTVAETARVGERLPIRFTVTNGGPGPLENRVVRIDLPEQFEHRLGRKLDYDLPRLAPGERHTARVTTTARAAGAGALELRLQGAGAVHDRWTGDVTITADARPEAASANSDRRDPASTSPCLVLPAPECGCWP